MKTVGQISNIGCEPDIIASGLSTAERLLTNDVHPGRYIV
jgi:hypothetical protein